MRLPSPCWRYAAIVTHALVATTLLLAIQPQTKASQAIASETTATPLRQRIEIPLTQSRYWPDAKAKIDIWHPPCVDHAPNSDNAHLPPVIISNVGLGGKLAEESMLLATLAKSGYIVLAVGDIADNPLLTAAQDRAAQMLRYKLTSQSELARFKMLAARRSELGADFVSAVLNELKQSPSKLDDPRCPTVHATSTGDSPGNDSTSAPIDNLRLGLLGHSFGSSVLAAFAKRTDEDQAMVNLDGWLFAESLSQLEEIPYLALTGDLTHVTSGDVAGGNTSISSYEASLNDEFLAWHNSAGNRAKVKLRHINGAIHADFSNEERSDQQRWKDWISGRDTQRSRIRRLIIDQVARFFLTHLRPVPAADTK